MKVRIILFFMCLELTELKVLVTDSSRTTTSQFENISRNLHNFSSFVEPYSQSSSSSIGNESPSNYDSLGGDSLSFHSENQVPDKTAVEVEARTLNIDKFFSNFENYDCLNAVPREESGTDAENLDFNNLCPHLILSSALSTIGEYDNTDSDLIKYLNEDVYMPLAMKMLLKDNMGDLINDAIFGVDKMQTVNPKSLKPVFTQLQSKVMRNFEDIALKSQDFDHYREDINSLILSVMKDLHFYWNSLRTTNQFEKARIDTRELLRVMLRSFDMKQQFMVETIRNMVNKIKEAYYRFVRAHKIIEVLNKSSLEIIVFQINRRVNNALNAIKSKQATPPKIVREIGVVLRLVQVFHIISYRRGNSEEFTFENFNNNIYNPIVSMYEQFKQSQPAPEAEILNGVKQFIVSLLLKMKHLNYIIYEYHTVSEFVNFPQAFHNFNSRISIKV